MPAASPGIYQALGMHLESRLVLPELIQAAPSVEREALVQVVEADHRDWPTLEVSPHSTPTLQLAPQEWRLELEGIGWFRATSGERLEWQRWDDSVSDRDIRTFAVTSGLGALAIQRGALVLHGTALERDGEAILLLGHPVAGKSTLAWCLLQQGWRLLSSELVAVSPDGLVLPGMHQLKLWHDAAVALELNWQQLPPVRKGLKRLVQSSRSSRSTRNRISPGQQQLPFALDVRLNQFPEEWHQVAVRFRRANGIRDADRERSDW